MSRVTVDTFDGPAQRLDRLVARWPFKPHQWLADGSPDALERLVVSRIEEKLRRDDTHAWVASRDGNACGLLILEHLAWDSRVLGIPAGKLDFVATGESQEPGAILNALLDASLTKAKQRQIQHVTIRVDAGDDASIHTLERRGFLNVDALATYGAAVDDLPHPKRPDAVVVRPGSPADAARIGEIAALAFVHGRFHSDPVVGPERAASVYRTWAEACCAGTAADAVLLATAADTIAGFVACRVQRDTGVHLRRSAGTITLIASHGTMRGRGIGTRLVAAAAEWFRQEGAAAVEVGTQLRNVAAARLYERCGFRLVSGALSFRMMIG